MIENRKRNIQIKFWVTPEENAKILEKVKLSNMPICRYLRNAALKKEIVNYDFASLFELSAQISRIGNNINQIAKKLNQGGLVNKGEINYLKGSLESINKVFEEIYRDILSSMDKE